MDQVIAEFVANSAWYVQIPWYLAFVVALFLLATSFIDWLASKSKRYRRRF